jgi:hypothetical protein
MKKIKLKFTIPCAEAQHTGVPRDIKYIPESYPQCMTDA